IFMRHTFTIQSNARPSFVHVESGESREGKRAEIAEQQNDEVATNPDPSEVEPENPEPDSHNEVQEQEETTDEDTKEVDLADQQEDIQEEEVETPETDKVDPENESAAEQHEEVTVPPKTEKEIGRAHV